MRLALTDLNNNIILVHIIGKVSNAVRVPDWWAPDSNQLTAAFHVHGFAVLVSQLMKTMRVHKKVEVGRPKLKDRDPRFCPPHEQPTEWGSSLAHDFVPLAREGKKFLFKTSKC